MRSRLTHSLWEDSLSTTVRCVSPSALLKTPCREGISRAERPQ